MRIYEREKCFFSSCGFTCVELINFFSLQVFLSYEARNFCKSTEARHFRNDIVSLFTRSSLRLYEN